MRGVWLVAGLLSLVAVSGCLSSSDPVERDHSRISLELLVSGLDDPVFVTHANDGSGRLFVVEQGGEIWVWNGTLISTPFLDIQSLVSCCSERGLLGLAFHPNYAANGRFFVQYTARNGDVTLAEYNNPEPADDAADPASGKILLAIEHSTYSNHNGGMLAFGPDGMLYSGVGDGGSGGDPNNNAQDLESLLGKILRLDVNVLGLLCPEGTLPPQPYCIPRDNPFVGKAGRDEIWHYGLRNPWRFSFDRTTGNMWIGDVGQSAFEEIDFARAGKGGLNYGWSRFEGTSLYNDGREAPGAVPPVAQYANDVRTCSVTGGYLYRGKAIPDLVGSYVFSDYCAGTIWTLRADGSNWERRELLQRGITISSFGDEPNGELLVVDHAGAIYRIVGR